MADPCIFCTLLQVPQNAPTFIAEFEHTAAFLDYDQEAYPGRSILVLKNHHDHLHLVPVALQQAIVPELVNLTTAILSEFGGTRANHQSLGNQVPHVHWHIIPRRPGDLNAGHAPQYTVPDKKMPDDGYRDYAARIRSGLGKVGA